MTVKKPKGAFAYQYQYATNSNMSNAVTVNEKATSYKFAATPTKNYYVRVRSFARANGKTYYSGWTTVKKVNKVK